MKSFPFPSLSKNAQGKPRAITNHACMNLQIAEAQPLFCKERYIIVSGGSADCLCLYIFLCADRPEKESRLPLAGVRKGQAE